MYDGENEAHVELHTFIAVYASASRMCELEKDFLCQA